MDWFLADQVLFEYYNALRNPRILKHPLGAAEASESCRFLRERSGIRRCCYRLDLWERIIPVIGRSDFPYRRTHDAVLAATLLAVGVRRFYTRNIKDFQDAGFDEVINPID